MTIPPRYRLTKEIAGLLADIERLKAQLDLLPQIKIQEKFLRRKSILKSAVYSARIEGNPRQPHEISIADLKQTKDQTKLESVNIYRAIEFILQENRRTKIKIDDVKKIHRLAMDQLSAEAGILRQQPSAIFNSAGIAIYICPSPAEIKTLLQKLLFFINRKTLDPIPVKALLAHLVFEKVHPFLDGNGRVGRLLIHAILKQWRYNLRGLSAFEQYFENHRQEYYDLLAQTVKDATAFVSFGLKALRFGLKKTISSVHPSKNLARQDLLPPRRQEILAIIRDHRQASFDFLHRRFPAVSGRLLRYDLKKLQTAGLIKKLGVTRGAVYEYFGYL